MEKKCPFQIIEEIEKDSGTKNDRMWLCLKENIMADSYKSIVPFHEEWRKSKKVHAFFDKKFLKRLFLVDINNEYVCTANIAKKEDRYPIYDCIRNPTIEELQFIKNVIKRNGYIYNRKLNKLDINNN